MSNKQIIGWVIFAALFFYILCIVGVCWSYSHSFANEYEITGFFSFFRGEIGDTFNIVTSLFGAAGTILLVWTLLMSRDTLIAQRKALELQGQELIEQRKELSLTRLEFSLTRATEIIHTQAQLIIDYQNSNDYVRVDAVSMYFDKPYLKSRHSLTQNFGWFDKFSERHFEKSDYSKEDMEGYLFNIEITLLNSFYVYQQIALAAELIEMYNDNLLTTIKEEERELAITQTKTLKRIFINSIRTSVRHSLIEFDKKFGSAIETYMVEERKKEVGTDYDSDMLKYPTFVICAYLVQISRFCHFQPLIADSQSDLIRD